MLSSLAFFLRKTVAAIAVAGFLVLPGLLSQPAQAETATYRLMETYQPPGFAGSSALELGVKVSTSKEGWIRKVYYYNYWGDFGGHSAHIWSANGTLLGSQDFVNETTGWQVVELDNPVHVVAGQTFTVSVYGSTFYYAGGAFPSRTSGPLTILDSNYKYTDHSEFPQDTVHTNYAIDFDFTTQIDPNTTEPDPGLRVDVYTLDGVNLPDHQPDYVLCSSTTFTAWKSVADINHEFDADYGGIVAGCAGDYVMIHYTGYLTWPKTQRVELQALADDGFFMTLDGDTVFNDWSLKGCSGSKVFHDFVANKPQKLDAWFFEWGGGACSRLGYLQNGGFVAIPKEAYSKNKNSTAWVVPAVAPSKPRNVQATVSGVDISVSWDEPAQDGGAALSGYTATASGGGQFFNCHSNVQNRSCTINNLPAGRQYSITVVAHSDSDRLQSQDSDSINKTIGTGVLHPSVTAPRMDPLTYGQVLTDGTLLGGSSNVPGSFSFKYPNTQPDAGVAVVELVFTPVDTTTYTTESLNIEVQVNKATRNLTWSDATTEPWAYGSLHNSQVEISVGDGPVTYSVTSPEVCSINETTGELTALRAGQCDIQAQVQDSANYLGASNQQSLTILPLAPASPGDVQVNVSDTSATVSWTASPNDGGTAISSYLVNLRNGDELKTCRVTAEVLSCTIDSLTQGVEYTVEVISFSNQDQLQSEPGISNLAVPTLVIEPEPTPDPTDEPYVDPRPYEVINPVEDDPAGVAQKTVAAITLVSAVAAAGAAVAGAAGAAGAASGAASGGASSSSSNSSGGAKTESKSSESEGHEKHNEVEEVGHLRHLSRGKIDEASLFGGSGKWGDLLMVWSLPLVVALDNPPKKIAKGLSRVLPLGAKIFSDGAYLRAMFGSFSALLTLVSLIAGVVGVTQAGGMLVIPSALVVATIVLIGTLDVLSGFLGAAALAIGLALVAGIHTPADIRFLFGIVALGVVPRVISGAFRALRREVTKGFSYHWERLLDYVVAPMLASWAVFQIVGMLPIFAGIALPVEELGQVLPLVVAIGMVSRVSLEEIAGRYFPDRIAYVQVDNLPKAPLGQVLISTVLRAGTFAFVAAALIGVSWHLFVGAFIFVLPNILALFQSKFPNSRKLYHLMPQGLVNLAVSLWLGQVTLIAITGIFHETPDLAKLGFVLLPIPSLILSIMKLFGRHGYEGEPRFYEKPNMGWFYRFGTIIMIYITAELTHTINTTNLL